MANNWLADGLFFMFFKELFGRKFGVFFKSVVIRVDFFIDFHVLYNGKLVKKQLVYFWKKKTLKLSFGFCHWKQNLKRKRPVF